MTIKLMITNILSIIFVEQENMSQFSKSYISSFIR